MRNWSGHVQFAATEVVEPKDLDTLQSLVARSPRIRPLGTGHSFNDIADTDGVHVVLSGLPQSIDIDENRRIAWLPGGMRYGTAARLLDADGWAVHNMASLGHISVAGTVATGTHGSGDRNPTLSASVVGLERVRADGDIEIVDMETAPAELAGSVVALGTLGIVTRVAVRIEPRFDVRQYVIDDVSHDTMESAFDEIFSSAYSVSFFTTWSAHRLGQVWMKRREGVDASWDEIAWMGGRVAAAKRHPLPGHDPRHCTEQLGTAGPWHERLPHFKLDFTPSSGDELQTEYLVPRDLAVAALRDVATIAPAIHEVLHVSEVRTMCADDLWLSGAFGRPTVGIHFTWRKTPDVLPLLPRLDALFSAYGGRPHWGKLFSATTPLGARYPHFPDFAGMVMDADPRGKFRNSYVEALLSAV
jgi:xylitol oxidase